MVTYSHITRGSNTLLICFSNMLFVGTELIFGSYNIINSTFNCDILFIKDIDYLLWYLTVMEECRDIIINILEKYHYSHMYALTESSGTIPTINITSNIDIFREAVIINGQPTLKADIVDSYSHCVDCPLFDPTIVGPINKSYLTPLESLAHNLLKKYVFYNNDSISDYQNYLYLTTIYPLELHNSNLHLESLGENHGAYIGIKYVDSNFMNYLKYRWML